ncbi:MAG: undecaprenyl-diphosphate phosphatase [Desulfamplus sp.]|nr:undecaprenyl-diphosphate phosphatase [Desulfamplus sp.]
METYQALLLGILQGLTEFLPVSSSGHIAFGQYVFNIKEPTLFFNINLHIGTLIAVIIVFFENIKSMFISLIEGIRAIIEILKNPTKSNLNLQYFNKHINENPDIRLISLIIVGSIPTAIIGIFLKQYVEIFFDSINFVGTMLIITGTFLWFTKDIKKDKKDNKSLNIIMDNNNITNNYDTINDSHSNIMRFGYKEALFIGICQGVAVVPGISRSGATIAAGLFSGIERETAAKFSFLLSIPAIVGAELLGFKDILASNVGLASINISTLYGTLMAFVVGYIALKLLLKIVKVGKLYLFAPYCWILGVIAVIMGVL